MWISWLLKYDGYPPGVVVALLLHGILMWIFLPKEFDAARQVNIEPATYVVASAVTQSPQRMRRIEQQNTQRRNEEAQRERERQAAAERQRQQAAAEQQRQAEAERQRQAEAERQRVAEAERQRQAEAERQRQAEAERQRRAEEERRRQETAQRESNEAAQRAAEAQRQALTVEQEMVSQYMALIRDLVSGAWSRPPSARNGMVAIVQLRLAPTGEIIDRQIVSSSGDPGFDRSVLQAVDRVGSFSELQEMPTAIFERNFRAFQLKFSPEDLLR